jgi:hypothetical protein
MKMCPVGVELFMRTDGHDEANSRIRSLANAPTNGKIILFCPFAHSYHLQNYSVDFDKMLYRNSGSLHQRQSDEFILG